MPSRQTRTVFDIYILRERREREREMTLMMQAFSLCKSELNWFIIIFDNDLHPKTR